MQTGNPDAVRHPPLGKLGFVPLNEQGVIYG